VAAADGAKSPAAARCRDKRKVRIAVLTALVILFITGFLLWDSFHRRRGDGYTHAEGQTAVHFLDVGQGDCMILQLPDGKAMLIDAGPNSPSARNKIVNYIAKLRITRFDYVLLTHSDADHSGGMAAVFGRAGLTFGTVYMPYLQSASLDDRLKDTAAVKIDTAVYRRFTEAAYNSGADIEYSQAGTILGGGDAGYSFTFYTPATAAYVINPDSAADKNSVSPIVVLACNGRRVMFTGDANTKTENAFLGYLNSAVGDPDEAQSDVLKVGHHGSATSSTQSFLDAVQPDYAVISVGAGNSYGHPAPAALARLRAVPGFRALYRTDTHGDIILTITKESDILWETEKQASVSAVVVTMEDFAGVYLCLRFKK